MQLTDPAVPHIRWMAWSAMFASHPEEGDPSGRLKTELIDLISQAYSHFEPLQGKDEVWKKKQSLAESLTDEVLKDIRKEFNKHFSMLVDVLFLQANITEAWIYWSPRERGGRFFQNLYMPKADPKTQAIAALGLHLQNSELTSDRIRRCPECNSFFVRVRKPEAGEKPKPQYCSPTCARKAANRAYLERQKAPPRSPRKPAAKDQRVPIKKGKSKR